MVDLGTLPGGHTSLPRSINILGHVVGQSDLADPTLGSHAFLYSNGVMKDLNNLISHKSGWILANASGINDRGQIIGDGFLNGIPGEAFILTPVCGERDEDDDLDVDGGVRERCP
jgi:probable HAF family extracellular repeat protein